jgi:gliding motility-associated lipoprotein GldD
MKNINKVLIIVLLAAFSAGSCKQSETPKPRGYFRIDFPEKKYTTFDSECPYSFEYPIYGKVEKVEGAIGGDCWINITFPAYKAKIYLTYKPVRNNLAQFVEDIHTITYKHTIKADDIVEVPIKNDAAKVFGIIYKISGNTASSINFFATDSTKHFLSGALYFSSTPNSDSLMPCLQFFQEDVVHLTESLHWK